MPGPEEYVGVRGPTPASYQAPQVDFSWLGNLMQDYRQAQLAPVQLALARNELARSGLELGALRQYMGGLGQPSPSTGPQGNLQPPQTPTGGTDVASALKYGIYGQESDYGRNPSTSSAGARGPMQIIPKTFAAYALPGENIDNPIDNKRVGDRMLDKYLERWNGDWARAAVAYYSGEGNVAPPGSPTPWKVNKQPQSGPSVAGYVQQVGARMARVQGRQPAQGTGTSQPAPNEDLATAAQSGPPFARTASAAQSTNASGPENVTNPNYSRALTGGQAAAAGLTPQQIAIDQAATREPAAAVAGQGQGVTAGPPNGAPPQPIRTAQTQPQLSEPEFDPQVLALRRRAQMLMQQAQERGMIGSIARIPGAEQNASLMAQQAKIYQDMADERVKRLTEERKMQLGIGVEAETKGRSTVTEAMGKRQGEAIEAGGPAARHTVNTLDVMEDALKRGGSNISTGPGAAEFLKVKQAANNLYPGLFEGVAESEIVTKLNATLAAEAAKAMTARPSQLEFKTFVANNPGLLTSIQGTRYLIDVLRQARQQDIELGRIAMRNPDPRNWGDIEEKFYNDPKNQIKSPFTGKPLSGKEAAPSDQQQLGIPERPAHLPSGSQFSPSRKMWRDPGGRMYDASGRPVT
jgi:hypothetical protein